MKTNIIEIFSSLQGEGVYIGQRQLFIRFANCNLNCAYCDTKKRDSKKCRIHYNPYNNNVVTIINNPVSSLELKYIIDKFAKFRHHSISLTGNEPLLSADFLKSFLSEIKTKIFLETNGTLPEELKKIIKYIDIISMDLKLNSVSIQKLDYEIYKQFLKIGMQKELYVKLVVDKNLTLNDIKKILELKLSKELPIVIQPVTVRKKRIDISPEKLIKLQDYLSVYFNNVIVIPQVHKFLNLI